MVEPLLTLDSLGAAHGGFLFSKRSHDPYPTLPVAPGGPPRNLTVCGGFTDAPKRTRTSTDLTVHQALNLNPAAHAASLPARTAKQRVPAATQDTQDTGLPFSNCSQRELAGPCACPNCGTILAGEGIASESRQEPAGCAKDSVGCTGRALARRASPGPLMMRRAWHAPHQWHGQARG